MSPVITQTDGHYHAADGTFRKRTTAVIADREAAGHAAVAGAGLLVPHLLDVRPLPDGRREMVYEDVFASGRCHRLLADAINAADRDLDRLLEVRTLVNAVCDDLLAMFAATGVRVPLADCMSALYAQRLAPGARLDHWYTFKPQPRWRFGR